MQTQSRYMQLPPQNFAQLGMEEIAYIREVELDGAQYHAIFAANGVQVGAYANRDVAVAACMQHELEPLSVH